MSRLPRAVVRRARQALSAVGRRSSHRFKSRGTNVVIERGCRFHGTEKIDIGSNIYFGFECLVFGFGGVSIGSGTIFGHRVEILTRNHNFDSEDLRSIPYDERYVFGDVQIGQNCWVGAGAKILPGVTIGEGAVIGMGAVVAKNVAPLSVVVGNPAKIVKHRDRGRYETLKAQGKIYMRLKFERSEPEL